MGGCIPSPIVPATAHEHAPGSGSTREAGGADPGSNLISGLSHEKEEALEEDQKEHHGAPVNNFPTLAC